MFRGPGVGVGARRQEQRYFFRTTPNANQVQHRFAVGSEGVGVTAGLKQGTDFVEIVFGGGDGQESGWRCGCRGSGHGGSSENEGRCREEQQGKEGIRHGWFTVSGGWWCGWQ